MMIPKIIHYAWFGKKPLPESAVKCIESWKKYCPDYEIKRWDETNYDYKKHRYMREAYESKKFAFVVDYMRLDVLYQYGGIFFDTDVEVIKNFDPLLTLAGFAGFEHGEHKNEEVNVGIGIGSEAGNPVIKAMLDDYQDRKFLLENGGFNMTPCPIYQTNVLKKFGIVLENYRQDLGDIVIFPTDYFCPVNYYTGKTKITINTYIIHHYTATWMPFYRKVWHFLKQKFLLFRYIDSVRRKVLNK